MQSYYNYDVKKGNQSHIYFGLATSLQLTFSPEASFCWLAK